MLKYIADIARETEAQARTVGRGTELFVTLPALYEELKGLDSRDFAPSVRQEFALDRVRLRRFAEMKVFSDTTEIADLVQRLAIQLESYGGLGSVGVRRNFSWLLDADLRRIVERDYLELCLVLVPGAAWKSAVVLAGSIVEAILFDIMSQTRWVAPAMNSNKAPKDRQGNVKPISSGDWKLHDLIEVATEIRLIPSARSATFDQVLRDYRNFVHPKKEIRAAHPCTEAEALMSKGALDALLNHFDAIL